MADHTQQQLAIVDVVSRDEDDHPQGYLVIDGSGGGAPVLTTYYDMSAIDDACATGAARHVWRVTGSPDLTGASAGALPCGGPLSDITILATFSV